MYIYTVLCIYIYILVCMYRRIYTHIYIHIYTHVYTHVCIYTSIHVYTYVYTYIHNMDIHIYIYPCYVYMYRLYPCMHKGYVYTHVCKCGTVCDCEHVRAHLTMQYLVMWGLNLARVRWYQEIPPALTPLTGGPAHIVVLNIPHLCDNWWHCPGTHFY